VRRDAIGRHFVSLQLSSENPFVCQMPKTGAVVGIDLNLDNFLWDSNDHVVENQKHRRNMQPKLKKLQRSLSRKAVQAKKDKKPLRQCKNYQKNRVKLAKLHLKTAARAEDFRHVISKGYVKNHDYIFAEDLKVKNLLKNHSLAFAISECSWSDFLSKLDCKANMYGKTFLKVAPHYTTQTCSVCGHVLSGDDKLMLGDREWVCPNCNTYHVRDYNAAKNIMAKGLASLGLTAS
jgi:putative transposase